MPIREIPKSERDNPLLPINRVVLTELEVRLSRATIRAAARANAVLPTLLKVQVQPAGLRTRVLGKNPRIKRVKEIKILRINQELAPLDKRN